MRALTNSDIRIEAKTSEVLAKLVENRTEHVRKYKEAREGYLEDVKAELLKASTLWATQTNFVNDKLGDLYVSLSAPRVHTDEYDTAITMMRFHSEDTITLDASQVRYFLMDQWDWKNSFEESFVNYSKSVGAAR